MLNNRRERNVTLYSDSPARMSLEQLPSISGQSTLLQLANYEFALRRLVVGKRRQPCKRCGDIVSLVSLNVGLGPSNWHNAHTEPLLALCHRT